MRAPGTGHSPLRHRCDLGDGLPGRRRRVVWPAPARGRQPARRGHRGAVRPRRRSRPELPRPRSGVRAPAHLRDGPRGRGQPAVPRRQPLSHRHPRRRDRRHHPVPGGRPDHRPGAGGDRAHPPGQVLPLRRSGARQPGVRRRHRGRGRDPGRLDAGAPGWVHADGRRGPGGTRPLRRQPGGDGCRSVGVVVRRSRPQRHRRQLLRSQRRPRAHPTRGDRPRQRRRGPLGAGRVAALLLPRHPARLGRADGPARERAGPLPARPQVRGARSQDALPRGVAGLLARSGGRFRHALVPGLPLRGPCAAPTTGRAA